MAQFKTFLTALLAGSALTLSNCGDNGSRTSAPPVTGGGGSGSGGGNGGVTPPVNTGPQPTLAEAGDILVNQHAYTRSGQKIATLVRLNPAPVRWELIDGAERIYASGLTTSKGVSSLSGLTLHEIDFSDYVRNAPNVRLRVAGKLSEVFNITDRPYNQLTIDSAKYFYESRANSPVLENHIVRTVPSRARPAAHTDTSVTCFSGEDIEGNMWPSCGYNLDIEGGWYDAGDYGLYAINTGMTVWAMQNIFEREMDRGASCSVTASLNNPESGNEIHDLLEESRKGMDFLMSLQITSGAPVGVTLGDQSGPANLNITQISAPGMVHHKVHGRNWPGDTTPPQEDLQTRYLYPPTTAATLHLAAMGAQCARVWADIDADYAAQCLSAAETAYGAAQITPNAMAHDNFNGGGPYSDERIQDEFAWAATELFLTTENTDYLDDILEATPTGFQTHGRVQPSWRDTEGFAMLSVATQFVRNPDKEATPLEAEVLEGLTSIAGQYAEQIELTGFNVPDDDSNYYWGSNSNLLFRAVLMGTVQDATGVDYSESVQSVMSYILGHNPLNQSYVTGFGDQTVKNPHHRFWSYTSDRRNPLPPRGLLSGGPNNTALVDPISSQLVGQCLAQTCWVDEFDAYAFNEVSLSWNASLLWTANWLDEKSQTCSD